VLDQSQTTELQRIDSATFERRDGVDSPKGAELEPKGGKSDVMKKPDALVRRILVITCRWRVLSGSLIVNTAVEAFTGFPRCRSCGLLWGHFFGEAVIRPLPGRKTQMDLNN
jgi:hypothetical protein